MDYVPVSDIRNSQSDGFELQMVVYVRAAHDGHILLAASNNNETVYEIGKFLLEMKYFFAN